MATPRRERDEHIREGHESRWGPRPEPERTRARLEREREGEPHGVNPQYAFTTQEDRTRYPAAHQVERISAGMPPDQPGLHRDPAMYVDKPGPGFWSAPYHAIMPHPRHGDYASPLDRGALNAYDRQVQPTDAERAFGYAEPEPERGQGHRGRGPRHYRRIEPRVLEDVCDALTHDPGVDASDIEVRVEDGVVHLHGTVASRQQKRRAELAADNIPGVADVMNALRVLGA